MQLGVHAHIHAASPGGPRYDPDQSPEQRKSAANGIYLCAICADAIDRDPNAHPAKMLREWKAETRRLTFLEATQGVALATSGVATADLAARALEAARADIATFMRGPRWPAHAVKLGLHLVDGDTRKTFDADGLARASRSFTELVLVAPPGTGKSTSLIQITRALAETEGVPAAFVRLSEWSTDSASLLEHVGARRAFRKLSAADLADLAEQGQLCLSLDGWNELSTEAQERARIEIAKLTRDYPNLSIILSTRRQALQVPLDGPTIEVAALSPEQQMEIAGAVRGEEGRALVDQAWRTPGLYDLVGIPLYLNTLLRSGSDLPTTKDEIISLFVAGHERRPVNAAVLRHQLQEQQTPLLASLAFKATTGGVTVLSESDALEFLANERSELLRRGPATSLPPPIDILDVLVNHHCLMREGSRAVSFQHQQIQEWYAGRALSRLMREALTDPAAAARLRVSYINFRSWEEPILFACEYLSRLGDDGAAAVAKAIVDTLQIDPLLAATMISRSSEATWTRVADQAMGFAKSWHKAGEVDRAFRFIATTGRSEFGDIVWPLITSDDRDTQYRALRAARPFQRSLLGAHPEDRIRALPENVRENLLSEIALDGDFESMDLAATIARDDPSAALRVDVIRSLAFRGADRFVARIVDTGDDALWKALADTNFPEMLADSRAAGRLQRMRSERRAEADGPAVALWRLMQTDPNAIDPHRIAELIESPDYDLEKDRAMRMAARRFPAEAGMALVRRLEGGLAVPSNMDDVLRGAGLKSDHPAIAEMVLGPKRPAYDSQVRAAASVAGASVVKGLLEAYLATDAEIANGSPPYPKPLLDAYQRFRGLLSKVDGDVLVNALLERANQTDPQRIHLLAGVVAGLGGFASEERQVDVPSKSKLVPQLIAWGELLLSRPDATRDQMSGLADAMARVASPSFIPVLGKLVQEDLRRWREARAQRAQGKRVGALQPDECTDHTAHYARAFAALSNAESVGVLMTLLPDLEFGPEAAVALLNLWERTTGRPSKAFIPSLFFTEARRNLLDRQNRSVREPIHPFARAVLEVVERYSSSTASSVEQDRAFRLGAIALAFPHGDDITFCDRLLDLDGNRRGKLSLLTSMIAAGYVVAADRLIAGVQLLYEDARSQPWLVEEREGSELSAWVNLFAYSDRPSAVLDVLQRLEKWHRAPWQLRNLLSALANNASLASEELLAQLLKEDARFATSREWSEALVAQGTASALDVLLRGLATQDADKRASLDTWSLARKLAVQMERSPEVRAAVYVRYSAATSPFIASVLEHAIGDAPDDEGVLRVIERQAADHRTYRQGILPYALRQLATGETAAGRKTGLHEIVGVPLTSLRSRLFALTAGEGPRADLAAAALNEIDELRDTYGEVEDEPRHPDIATGRGWPIIGT